MSYILKYLTCSCVAVLIITTGCGDGRAKKRLADQQQDVERREKELSLREQQLKLNEVKLAMREQRLDSADRQRDSVGVYDPKIIGNWTVTMQCTQTNCTGYAIGDIKTEQWNISYDNNTVLMKAYVNKVLVRTYTGLFRNNMIALTSNLPEAQAHIDVVLALGNDKDKLMTGQRTINTGSECRTVFALRAEKK